MDVQVHGGLSRDGLARRSPATGAAPGAGMLVHPITNYCGENCKASRRSLSCSSLFPQFWHVKCNQTVIKLSDKSKHLNIHRIFSQ